METDQESKSEHPDYALQIMRRITDLRLAFLLVPLVLAVDIGLIFADNQGLLDKNWDEINRNDYVRVGLILTLFIVWTAVLLNIVRAGVEMAIALIFKRALNSGSDPNALELNAHFGRVSLTRARKDMLEKKDEFWCRRIDAIEKEHAAKGLKRKQAATFAFSAVLLMIADYCLGEKAILPRLVKDHPSSLTVMASAFFAAALMYWLISFRDDFNRFSENDTMVEHPELAKRYLAEVRQRRGLKPFRDEG